MKASSSTKRRIHYVLSTHWDREWYQTFQDYRRRLVHLLDRVLDDIESRKLKGPFTLDGQAILLEDYLEIRPGRRDQVARYVKSGRLVVGPWYVMPDEWLVSGESLVRNIRLGRSIARKFGGTPSSAGFVCDLFGHVSQLPQVLHGFGVKGALIWRGLEPRRQAHVIWRGADGTELPCYRFGRAGYCDYTWDVRRATEPLTAFDPERALGDLTVFLAKEAERNAIPPLLLFDGGDHLEHDSDHYRLLFERQKDPAFPYELVHSTLDDYLEEMLRHGESIKNVVDGELRETGKLPGSIEQQWLIPGVLSSRVWIKQANVECQTLLCQWAEPFASIATSFLGAEYPTEYLQVAWKWLLQNHPHDSICGCSIDEVHEDMKYRFAQCRQIATAQVDESLRLIAASVEGEIGAKEIRVLVANPLASLLHEPIDLVLQIPAEWGTYQEFFGFEPKPAFRIYDETGVEIPYQLLRQEMNRAQTRIRPLKFPEAYKAHAVTVALKIELPALGYRTLTVREGASADKSGPVTAAVLPTRHPLSGSLATSERSMENELLAVTIESNGTLTLTDKRTNEIYQRLLTFEDVADIGDGWYHGLAVNDQCVVSSGAHADVALIHNGPLLTQFRVRTILHVPKEYSFETRFRSEESIPLVLDSRVTLRAGTDRIEVVTAVDNHAKDHRLRVLFPSGTKAKTYLADSAFDVVERAIGSQKDAHLHRELPVETTPQQTWTAVTDKKRGLAIIATGLMESAVRDLPERPIGLTLFRATSRTVLTNGQPNGQLQGLMEFRYWIMPIAAGFERRQLFDRGLLLSAGLRSVGLGFHDMPAASPATVLPASASYLKVTGSVVVSSMRQVEDGLELRLFNPEESMVKATLDFSGWPSGTKVSSSVVRVDFESNPLGRAELASSNLTYRIQLKPKEIVTLRFSISSKGRRVQNGYAKKNSKVRD
jgi:alpha-mannosidase